MRLTFSRISIHLTTRGLPRTAGSVCPGGDVVHQLSRDGRLAALIAAHSPHQPREACIFAVPLDQQPHRCLS